MRRATLAAILLSACLATTLAAQNEPASPLRDSVPQGVTVKEVIPISTSGAIDRALKYNLGLMVSEADARVARAERLRALADLLPDIEASVTETTQQINLQAFGFRGFVGVPPVVGPFSVFDARARLFQPIVNLHLVHELRKESQELAAANFAQKNVREWVVLITTDLYLEAVAGRARVDAARAQVRTAQAVYDRAVNLKDAGAVAAIDVLRAQVQLQERQQRMLAVQNDQAKQLLRLAKAIGLPLDQQFELVDALPTVAGETPVFAAMLEDAFNDRPDYLRAQALVRAAEESLRSAESRRLPSIDFRSEYGDIGRSPGSSHGTFLVQAGVQIPIFQGGRVKSEINDAQAVLDQRKAEAESLRSRIDFEIRSAYLDIESAAEQVRVAESAVRLADQQVVQAQDRFSAGVADSLEVVQAQQAVAVANENYISSLFDMNAARAALARAAGSSEQMIRRFFGGGR